MRITEAQFQAQVIELAQLSGFMVAHFRTSQTGGGRYVTAVAADGKGFPDLVLAHPRRGVLFRELKSERGRITKEQQRWIDTLRLTGADVAVWRPSDWFEIENYFIRRR